MLRRLWNRAPLPLKAGTIGALVAVLMVGLGVIFLRTYGVVLFLGSPFVMGLAVGYFLNISEPDPGEHTVAALAIAFGLATALMLVLAVEGLGCLVMAAPLAIPMALMGSAAGSHIGVDVARGPLSLGLLLLPIGWGVESAMPRRPVLHEVRSAVVIDAPPDVVWPLVLAFPPLPEPGRLWSATGLAFPREARIDGTGVGAIRYCVFSTGAFVEPITAWEPERRLAFDVTASPAPMRELSMWDNVHPPHLDGYLNSRRGEFRLIPLADGRTRLEGSTWYELHMAPAPYWRLITNHIIERIHGQVLGHIKTHAESTSR